MQYDRADRLAALHQVEASLIRSSVEEMWNGANVSLALCPMLTRGAIEALELRGSPAQ